MPESVAELEQQLTAAHQEMKTAKAKKRDIAKRLDAAYAAAAAQLKVDAMSPTERQAIAQLLGPNGIGSGAKVGTPGR